MHGPGRGLTCDSCDPRDRRHETRLEAWAAMHHVSNRLSDQSMFYRVLFLSGERKVMTKLYLYFISINACLPHLCKV